MTPHRLPRSVEPTTYRLTLVPDLDAATFSGTVDIDVVIHEPTDEIVVNAAELDITAVTIDPPAGERLAATVQLDPQSERATFRFPAPVPPGDATLTAEFTGMLNDQLRGFYRSTFIAETGATRTIATSQMEATDARRAFPCWDEPDRKATFEVTLVVDDALGAWSNSPVVDERVAEGPDGRRLRTVRFAPTMKMSTYLVAFVVGPLEQTDPVDVDGVPVRIVHAPGKGHLTAYALEAAEHALRFFTDYFGIAYPGDKLDLISIPDFAFGAMENLGCVTFRETLLIVDPDAASRVELERIADVISHEIAHMWFGDLVTMGWWEGIWLNEAFATFMATICVDHFRPAWQRWVGFGLERDAALSVDGLHTTRPIEYPVASPSDAEGMFDVLTYEKGGSVLRMLEQYLGAETFRNGVRRYLESHAYANTVTADLWDALEATSGEPVRAMMETWILQGGHPVVTVADGHLSQAPFSFLPEPRSGPSAIGSHWLVPVLLREPGADGASARLLLDGAPAPVPEAPDTVVNAGGWGVYRVAYPAERLGALGATLGSLAPLERFNLLSDTWALVGAGRADLSDLLRLAARLGDEDEPAVWAVVVQALSLCNRVATDEERPSVQAAARSLLGPRAASLGWERPAGEGERVASLRSLLIAELGTNGADPDVRAEAARRFDAASAGGPPVDSDLQGAVLSTVAHQLRPGDYETYLDRYRHPATPQEERRYLFALGEFPDADLCRASIGLAVSEVRSQDGPFLLRSLLANRVGGPVVWEQVKAHWDQLLERFPRNTHAAMVESVRLLCHDDALVADVTGWLTEHPLASGRRRSVEQALEKLEVNAAFARRHRGRLATELGPVLA